jgi:hypothetical protein
MRAVLPRALLRARAKPDKINSPLSRERYTDRSPPLLSLRALSFRGAARSYSGRGSGCTTLLERSDRLPQRYAPHEIDHGRARSRLHLN